MIKRSRAPSFGNCSLRRTIFFRLLLNDSIDLLLEQQQLPPEFEDHELNRRMSGYNEFHLRDTPKNKTPSETNDVLVVYTIDKDELVLIGIRVGSHDRLFPGQNRSKGYRKNDK